jgi:hypothetical protein
VELTINFVWIGPKPLGWLERFLIYAWRRWNCEVVLYAHRGPNRQHGPESLGLPDGVCRIIDLPGILAQDDESGGMGMDDVEFAEPIRDVLQGWCTKPLLPWDEGGQTQIYNMVDLTKSYIAATRRGVVLDLKIGPSPHLKTYVDAGVFENHFISYERAGIVENQCMGSMRLESDFRLEYAKRIKSRLVPTPVDRAKMKAQPYDAWFNEITSGHSTACVFGKKTLKYLEIASGGRAEHLKRYQIANASVVGIAGEQFYGPLRIFKRSDDQTNKGGAKTTLLDQVKMRDLTFREINTAEGAGKIDINAPGMPPFQALLALLNSSRAT